MNLIRKITPTMLTLVFLSSCGSALAATEKLTIGSAKPAISTPKPQLRGKVTQDSQLESKPDLKSQAPKVDPAPQLSGKIKRHALWDTYEAALAKTDDLGRAPHSFLSIQTVFRSLKDPKVDEGTKRFLSFLVRNWGTFTSNEDPPPINLEVLGANIWAIAEQMITISQEGNPEKGPSKTSYFTVDANEDNMLTREELVNAIKQLDAVPNDLKITRARSTFNYYRVRATLSLLLENFDLFDVQTNKEAYKYL